MSLYDVRGLFATDKEMAALACESLIQRSSCVEGH